MTAETAPQPERQVPAQGGYDQRVRYGVMLAAVAHLLLHDRRFHVAVITGAIGAVALADLIKNNQARPMRRAVSWYSKAGASKELARVQQKAHQELAEAGHALEARKRS
jgi:UDP-N-acetylglucosamine:LPS N-acetylglucosamine transferase